MKNNTAQMLSHAPRVFAMTLIGTLAAISTVNADTLVVPGYLTNTDYSLGAGTLQETSRYQQVYGTDEFPAGVKLLITELRFRPDYQSGNAFTTTVSNIRIDLSATTKSHDQLSTTFADNVGTNDTIVFSGPLSISSEFVGPSNGPKAFDIIIPLQTPFLYDPAAGNLLLDTRNYSGSTASRLGGTQPFDATSDTASRVANTDDANAASASSADSDVVALQIVYTPVNPTPIYVSLISLIASPKDYDGTLVSVVGDFAIQAEGSAIYLNEDDARHHITKNALRVGAAGDRKTGVAFDGKYVLVEGTFKARDNGSPGIWSGSIQDISKFQLWGQRANH